jgi:nicotinate-nucleotide adenylyltransferase
MTVDPIPSRYLRFPHVEKGMAVGLFGGSFNPPHAGHALVAEIAMRRLRLDQLWWMVTPGNPLKSARELAPLSRRIALSEKISTDPRIKVTAFEAAFRLRFSADTIDLVQARNPGVDFVWIMGADSLRDFHRWERWRHIARTIPIAVIDRPGATLAFLSSVMAKTFGAYQTSRLDLHPRPALLALLHRTPGGCDRLNAKRHAHVAFAEADRSAMEQGALTMSDSAISMMPTEEAPASGVAVASIIVSVALTAVGNGLMFAYIPVSLGA